MLYRLFVHGSFAPSGSRQQVLAMIPGFWEKAAVVGSFRHATDGSGCFGIGLADTQSQVEGFLFYSDRLAEHWDRLERSSSPALPGCKPPWCGAMEFRWTLSSMRSASLLTDTSADQVGVCSWGYEVGATTGHRLTFTRSRTNSANCSQTSEMVWHCAREMPLDSM